MSLPCIYPTVPLAYEPERWDAPGATGPFNCYSYALNTRNHGWLPLRGKLSGQLVGDMFAEDTRQSAQTWLQQDGLELIRPQEHDPAKTHILAYFITLAHFFRLDSNGIWSHKIGVGFVDNRNAYGQTLTTLAGNTVTAPSGRNYDIDEEALIYLRLPVTGIQPVPRKCTIGV